MKIDLKRSDSAPMEFDLEIESDDLDLETEFARVEKKVIAGGRVSNGENVTVVEADVSACLIIDCSRCLVEVPLESDFSFRTAFVSSDQLTEEQEVELDLLDLELSFAEEDEVDLIDVIREQIILNLPAHPLCKEDCKGLCEVCGVDLNTARCDCKKEETDPRWAALKDLK